MRVNVNVRDKDTPVPPPKPTIFCLAEGTVFKVNGLTYVRTFGGVVWFRDIYDAAIGFFTVEEDIRGFFQSTDYILLGSLDQVDLTVSA